MAARSEFLPQDRRQWLLAIGQRLRAEYSAARDPIPERLAALLARLEVPATTSVGDGGAASTSPAAEYGAPVEREAAAGGSSPCPPPGEGQAASASLDLR